MKLATTGKLFAIVAGTCFSAMVSAATTIVFAPTDGDVNTFDLSGFVPTGHTTFEMLDHNQGLSGPAIVLAAFDRVVFAESGGLWTATNLAGDVLNLGDRNLFQLAAAVGKGAFETATSAKELASNSWMVSFGAEADSLGVVDTTVVPVPAAVWLFGSGLVGLVGVARRKSA